MLSSRLAEFYRANTFCRKEYLTSINVVCYPLVSVALYAYSTIAPLGNNARIMHDVGVIMDEVESKVYDLIARMRAEAEEIEQRLVSAEEHAKPHYENAVAKLREYEAEAERHLQAIREGSSERAEHLKASVDPAIHALGDKMHELLTRLKK